MNGFAIKSRRQAAAPHNRSGLRPSLMVERPGRRYSAAGFGFSTETSSTTSSRPPTYW
jgi:hypothetical protein